MIAGKGDEMAVSEMQVDGTFPTGTTRYEKRNIALEVPVWDQDICIQCGKCYIACEDTSHQSIAALRDDQNKRRYEVIDDECVGCNLCMHVCPVDDCITMVEVDTGRDYANWTTHPNNPMRKEAAE